MKLTSKTSKLVVFTAILACMLMVGAGSAFAADQIVREIGVHDFTGECCILFNETVSVTESSTIKPVVVLFSFDYAEGNPDQYFVGLSVNGGTCQTESWGARALLDNNSSNFTSTTFQWVILPTDDVLVPGNNTFEICGGGKGSSSDEISIGDNTLTVFLE
jgi:hypothetical protein